MIMERPSLINKIPIVHPTNLFDGQLELGTIDTTGKNISLENRMRSKNYINVYPGVSYRIENNKGYTENFVCWYDNFKKLIKTSKDVVCEKAPINAKYMRFIIIGDDLTTRITLTTDLPIGASQNTKELIIPSENIAGINEVLYELKLGGVSQFSNSGIQSVDSSEFVLCAVKNARFRKSYHIIPEATVPQMPLGYLFHDSIVGGTADIYYAANYADKASKIGVFDGLLTNGIPRRWNAAIGEDGEIIWVNDSNSSKRGKIPRVHVAGVYDTAPELAFGVDDTIPQAWLQNCGIDFAKDSSGNEYCIFGEYTGSRIGTLHVWKVTKPYNDKTNWTKVMSKIQGTSHVATDNDIWHFHTANYDPYSNTWYVTSGDTDEHTKWWKSEDEGNTWTQIVDITKEWPSQVARVLNFIFTKDYIYWANDYGTNHGLYRLPRDSEGKMDVSNPPTKLCDLNPNQSTYATCYMHSPHGLLMLDRVDTAFAENTDTLDVCFWSFKENKLYTVAKIKRRSESGVFGFRCKAYTLYQGLYDKRMIVGFEENFNNMDMIYNDSGRRTTVTLEVI